MTRSLRPERSAIPWTFLGLVLAASMTLGLAGSARANDDIRDLPFVLDAVNDALETARTNVRIPWTNPATGNSGVIVVEKTFYPKPDMPCRQYRRTFTRPGQGEMMTRGTGCRTGPARWKIEEERTASRIPKATKSGPTTGSSAGATTTPAPPSPVGTTTSSAPRVPKATPAKTAKRPARSPSKSSTAAKAKPKAPPAEPAPPSLPDFTMPSKAEL